jgi:HAD superfamily hydrolase (TIGR01549 family)
MLPLKMGRRPAIPQPVLHPNGMKRKPHKSAQRRKQPALLFDLDGTLIDSVYQHILAWGEALEQGGMGLSNWTIHRRIGMSDELIMRAFARDAEHKLKAREIEQLKKAHSAAYMKRVDEVKVLPGAKELLATLAKFGVPHAIATSSIRERAEKSLKMLGTSSKVPVITGDEVENAKPHPDLFLAAAERLNFDLESCMVIGDSTWDLLAAQRARAIGVGFLSGGFGEDELIQAGAYRVYRDPADLLAHLDELGIEVRE